MRRFTKSLGRLSWALSLFGLGGLAELLGGRRGRRPSAAATAAFDEATGTFEQRFPQPFRTVFQVGDRLFGRVLDLVFENKASRSRKSGCGCGGQGTPGGWPAAGAPGAAAGWSPPHATAGFQGTGFSQAGVPGADFPGAGFPGAGVPGPGAEPFSQGGAGQHPPGYDPPWPEAVDEGVPRTNQGSPWGSQGGHE